VVDDFPSEKGGFTAPNLANECGHARKPGEEAFAGSRVGVKDNLNEQ
jgi:hypothetical protein